MKVDTKKPQPSEFRQDLLRGIRWGTILLIVMLLSIAAYRVLSSSPATASQPKPSQEAAAVPDAAPDTVIKVGDAIPKQEAPVQKGAALKGPDAPPAPQKQTRPPVRTAPQVTAPQVIEEPERLHAPRFTAANSSPANPIAVATPGKPPAVSNFTEPVPVAAETPAPSLELPNARRPELAPPPAADNGKQGNRATRAVRSVGRLFRFGKKDNEAKQGDASK
jgi:hypothetical protein